MLISEIDSDADLRASWIGSKHCNNVFCTKESNLALKDNINKYEYMLNYNIKQLL